MVAQQVYRIMPAVVQAASEPMNSIDKMTVISTDGAGSLAKTVASNVAQGLQLGTDLTGIDLTALLARLGGTAASPNGAGASGGGSGRKRAVKAETVPAIDGKVTEATK